MFKKMFKNQRGLTLIELLAVIVILGIIAAIAIPAIGGMIDNSKKDAHIANAEQIANAGRIYIATEKSNTNSDVTLTLQQLIDGGHMEEIKDPSTNKSYSPTATKVIAHKDTDKIVKFYVTLVAEGTGGKTYTTQAVTGKDVKNLTRTDISTN